MKPLNQTIMRQLNSIDLDHSAKAVLFLVIAEVKKCKFVRNIEWRNSPSKRGFHIKFFCPLNCHKCRTLYDDQIRIKADLTNRQPHERNVLWDSKSYKDYETKEITIKKAGKWHKVK